VSLAATVGGLTLGGGGVDFLVFSSPHEIMHSIKLVEGKGKNSANVGCKGLDFG
jgi:hypothetical protein